MIVYTVQPEIIYKKMREQGYLEGDKKFAMFPEAYDWMIIQMEKRIANCKVENNPVWLWQRKPSGNEKALATKGERWVILKLDVPEDKILWSSYEEWHSILNNNPITYSEKEWDYLNKRGFPKEEVAKTWERLFDHEWLASRPIVWAGKYKEHWIQGVTPRITMEQVKKVTRFIGKG
ncbi:DUF3841 domain-containing protein [Lysinibacillus sp. K60]|uniref:DUF3841 domain-containing protein n=1 Tax=Lysinibacillus sp. K60 TaxID=2720027 RepID=UPI001C8BA121|nr:DUF3841 domain-containing protein [Lysinibacillus sp. K60]MBX8945994.1 DUF3841 domain-containing protein [Lysinibacillus sp. K60]